MELQQLIYALINGEYYVDMAINDAIALNLRCVLFEIDSYICWGTPNDLRTFEYWQSCFNDWSSHPYQLEKDGAGKYFTYNNFGRGESANGMFVYQMRKISVNQC